MKYAFLIILLASCSQPPKVVGIVDGDGLKILENNVVTNIRLSDIDCPERHQPFGERARQTTADLAFGKTVSVKYKGKSYNRLVAEVTLPDGRSLNRELVAQGYAWWYPAYSKDKSYKQLEQNARENHLGLWADKHPVPPWEWRKNEKEKHREKRKSKLETRIPAASR